MRLDQLVFLLAPILQLAWVLTMLLGHIVRTLSVHYHISVGTPILSSIALSVVLSFLLSCITSVIVMVLEKKQVCSMKIGILSYWFFIVSWLPINAVCLFFRTKEWKSISHTRSVSVSELK